MRTKNKYRNVNDGGWEAWFAWHPIRIWKDRVTYQWVWWEWVERRRVVGETDYDGGNEYRNFKTGS